MCYSTRRTSREWSVLKVFMRVRRNLLAQSLPWSLTRPVLRLRGSSPAAPFCDLWVGAKRPGHLDALCRIVIRIFRRDDFAGCDALFGPSFQGPEDIAVRVIRGAEVQQVPEQVGSGSASTVHHARDHEQTVKVFGIVEASHLCRYALVVLNRLVG